MAMRRCVKWSIAGSDRRWRNRDDSGIASLVVLVGSHQFDEFERGFPERAEERQRRGADESYHALDGEIEQAASFGLIGRGVDNPKENHTHLKEPEDAGKTGFQVARDLDAA